MVILSDIYIPLSRLWILGSDYRPSWVPGEPAPATPYAQAVGLLLLPTTGLPVWPILAGGGEVSLPFP